MNIKTIVLLFFIFLSNFLNAQCVSGDCYSGKGKMLWNDGSSYEGDWLFGTMHGEGIFNYSDGSSYSGSWKMGVKHGVGDFYWKNGAKYSGDWFGGSYTGFGVYTDYAFGNGKSGEWMNGTLYESKDNSTVCRSGNCTNGNGFVVLKSGATYQGGFVDGNFSGHGIYKFNSGNIYEGNWLKGAYHGKGKFTFSNGDVYEGNFQFGVKHGFGVYKYNSGDIYEGNWFGGEISGIGRFTNSNGSNLEGFFIKGKLIKKNLFNDYTNKLTDTALIREINDKKLVIINKYNIGEINPFDLSLSYTALGDLLFNDKLYNEAIEIYNYAIELYSKNSWALLSRAYYNKHYGNNELACEDYKKVNENTGYRRRVEGFCDYVGDKNSDGLRNGTGIMTYCDGFVEKGLWVEGAFIGEWKYIDNRHKCYQCEKVLSIAKKNTADQIKHAQQEGVLTKSNVINLYSCEEYCSATCKNKAFAIEKAREKQYAKEMQSNLSKQQTSNSTSSNQGPSWQPCKYCNKFFDKPYIKDCKTIWRKETKPGYVLCSNCNGYSYVVTNNCDCGYWCYEKDCFCLDGWYECGDCHGTGQQFR